MSARTKIVASDLKFYPSERLTDKDDGGGLATGNPIEGRADELFNPVSSSARRLGAFYARLVYAGVSRADDAPLLGPCVGITTPPKDPMVNYVLTKAHSFGQTRAEGIRHIENYSTASVESAITILGTQSQGSKVVMGYLRDGDPAPVVGDVFCLQQKKPGATDAIQYIQVMAVDMQKRTFTDRASGADFVRMVIKLNITQPLKYNFVGIEYPTTGYAGALCKLFETTVVNAADYYGIKPLIKGAKQGDIDIWVDGPMAQLVPVSSAYTPMIDVKVHAKATLIGGQVYTIDHLRTFYKGNEAIKIHTGVAIYQGSVSISLSDDAEAITDIAEGETGVLHHAGDVVGQVDYAGGLLTIHAPKTLNMRRLSFIVAGKLSSAHDSFLVPIEQSNQDTTFVVSLPKHVAKGSIKVHFCAQGKFYTLTDNGQNALVGADPKIGSGSVSSAGTLSLTLGAAPDVGTAIIVSYASGATAFDRTASGAKASMILNIDDEAIPSTISINWQYNNNRYSARVDNTGRLVGHWTGRYDIKKRRLEIDTDNNFYHPAGALDVAISYQKGTKQTKTINAPVRGEDGNVAFIIEGEGALLAHSVRLSFPLVLQDASNDQYKAPISGAPDMQQVLHDDGGGALVDAKGVQHGTIDYEARRVTLSPDAYISLPKPQYKTTVIDHGRRNFWKNRKYSQISTLNVQYHKVYVTMPTDAAINVQYYDQNEGAQSISAKSGTFEVDLLPEHAESALESSILFRFGEHLFYDDAGLLYRMQDRYTGERLLCGRVDYKAGVATISAGAAGAVYAPQSSLQMLNLLSSVDVRAITSAAILTKARPINQRSFAVSAATTDGTQITAQADKDGNIIGNHIEGNIDYERGMIGLKFGRWVSVTDQMRADPDFDAEAVQDGKIWIPTGVMPNSLQYNATALRSLPIASQTVHIDTVRLPKDGKVAIFKEGDLVLLHKSQKITLDTAITAGKSIDLGVQNLSRVCLKDADGQHVDATQWDYDLAAGRLTFAQNLNVSGYALPLVATATIQENNRIASVDISGKITLAYPVRHNYEKGAYVSSLLVLKDLQVGSSPPFTQRHWDGAWYEAPNGEPLLNRLNVKDYPIRLSDDGAIDEKWLIRWLGASQFELYGKTLGFVKKADTLSDLAPINPATGKPYFTLPKQAFGADAPWRAQDVIRFNTTGALWPFWVLCSVTPSGEDFDEDDGFSLCLFGDTTKAARA